MVKKKYAWKVRALGLLSIGLALVNFVVDHLMQYYGRPFDAAFVLANAAFAMLGLVAVVIAKSLKQLESSTTRMEDP